MSERNPCIVSFFMDNIDMKTVGLQRSVVEKFNKNKIPHYQFKVQMPHGVAIDYFFASNGYVCDKLNESLGEQKIPVSMEHDAVLFLDIDAIPLNENVIDDMLELAYDGHIVGNAQRSNHIENDQHMFCAPAGTAISMEVYKKIGMPSAFPNERSDVLEEYTFRAEEEGIPVDLLFPLYYAEAPHRYEWEKGQPDYWALADGHPNYGVGTVFGRMGDEMIYHQFQSPVPGMLDKFNAKCEEILVAGIDTELWEKCAEAILSGKIPPEEETK